MNDKYYKQVMKELDGLDPKRKWISSRTKKILLLVTFPLWCIPHFFWFLAMEVWRAISEYVDESDQK